MASDLEEGRQHLGLLTPDYGEKKKSLSFVSERQAPKMRVPLNSALLVGLALCASCVEGNPFLTPHFQTKKLQHWNVLRDKGREMTRNGFKLPPDMWFNQTLDHYNALNQVNT